MAEKKKTTRPKKSPAKKKSASPRRQKTVASPSTPAPSLSSNKAPLYLLIILACAVVIAILVNQLYFRERSETRGTSVSEHAITQKSHKNQSTTALHEEKNDSAIKTQKEEKEEKKEIIESKVKVFFLRVNDRTERVSLVPVTRTIKGSASLEKALGELIKGPNQTERGKGLLSAVPSNIKVRGVSVKNGIAEIDFNDAVERNAAGSILISRLDQIVYTATEMDGIRGVIIKINGRRRQVFGSDGLSIGGPLHRRQ